MKKKVAKKAPAKKVATKKTATKKTATKKPARETTSKKTSPKATARMQPAASVTVGDDEVLVETIIAWRCNQRAHVFLIENLSEEALSATLSSRGGRNVRRQFTHIHNVRFVWLRDNANPLSKGLRVFGEKEEPKKRELLDALADSAARMETWFARTRAGEPGYKWLRRGGLVHTAGFLIAHESHHRGNMMLTLKQSGHRQGIGVSYGLWGQWNKVDRPD